MAKTPADAAATMMANIPEKTGKPLADWLKILKASGLEKHGQMVKLLKDEYSVTHGFANLIAHEALKACGSTGTETGEPDLVAAQYAGPKADLLPIYDALISHIRKFGKDVEIAPKKAYVSIRRAKQFAIVQPSTKTRVDLGLNLGKAETTERLEASGSFNSMVSHRVRLTSVKDIDKEVIAWLKQAYDAAN